MSLPLSATLVQRDIEVIATTFVIVGFSLYFFSAFRRIVKVKITTKINENNFTQKGVR